MITHPDYGILAVRLCVSNLHRTTLGAFVSHAIIVCSLPRCMNHSFRESLHFL